ncbi:MULTISPECIES: PH domain-containing protein [Streptomyces]|uniref:PH domain-containing protein n=1 Tax=Streptomyces glycanivorans TaxID=3033808 RepID=A0ABY9JL24_9ACTN|nr:MULTISPECIES: PH domain-containing protein [unclassified Streptomyces]WSQ81154.1 PH domain-containing protein [Streptomyces sp. NBC_01213]TXS10460.1 PH domain-containing protein [Streptomyces sp. wa22]WLQ67810.1 PH domain-containing protein [Streptomyces sp. Alt3]WSQ88485.1 PH domain-containing protein [Streptomyces sp. NBC_01212]WSR05508.1 PH domain-containing protein [Streptomyces sp. NBC_01208]
MSAPAPRAPELPALPATFRPTLTRVVLLAVGAAMFVVITAVALILENLGPGERTSFVFVALLFFGVLALLSRPHITADETGVTVVNITRTRRLAWAEILRVNLRAGDPWVFLDLSDGTSMPALGIQPGISKERAVTDARALRALVEFHGSGVNNATENG